MFQIKREGSKENFLDSLYNDFGYDELSLSYNYSKEGETHFSKWVKYSTLAHLDWNEIIPEYPILITRERFMERASHRSVLPEELIFDTDNTKWGGGYMFLNIESKARGIFNELVKKGVRPIVYKSGGKGYHLSIVLPQLKGLSAYERRSIKSEILKYYNCDLLMASSKKLIALEGEPNRKTGRIKEEVKF